MDFLLLSLIKIVIVLLIILTTVANLVYTERRVSAFIQNRIGPNRVGPWGLLQAPADVLKLFIKEDIVPANADHFVHTLAPIISIAVALSTFAVVPFGNTIMLFGTEVKLMIADVNIGVLYILAMTSMGVYGLTLSGWSSNNKYSLLGALRSSAQMISYELSMGLSVVGVIMMAGTVELDRIVELQSEFAWNVVLTPIGFITFLVASFAETNRLPFDLPEAEPELVGGYHTEYSGMKFGAFFLAEYANMITSSAIIVTLFLGGWQIPYVEHSRDVGTLDERPAGACLCDQGRRSPLFLYLGAVDDSAVPVRPADEPGMESDAATGACESGGDGRMVVVVRQLTGTNGLRTRRQLNDVEVKRRRYTTGPAQGPHSVAENLHPRDSQGDGADHSAFLPAEVHAAVS